MLKLTKKQLDKAVKLGMADECLGYYFYYISEFKLLKMHSEEQFLQVMRVNEMYRHCHLNVKLNEYSINPSSDFLLITVKFT